MKRNGAYRTEVALHLDMSEQRVRTLICNGTLPNKGSIDQYRFAYIRWLRGVASGHKSQDGKLGLTAERAKLTRAQTEKTEIEVAHLRGESLPRTLASQVWQMHAAAASTRAISASGRPKT